MGFDIDPKVGIPMLIIAVIVTMILVYRLRNALKASEEEKKNGGFSPEKVNRYDRPEFSYQTQLY